MADNYLMLDGKKYELSDDLIDALRPALAEPEKKNPFERKEDEIYFFITEHGEVNFSVEGCYASNSAHYAVANYCTDKSLMEQRAMHETLNRLLWRYSEEHGGDNPWDDIHEHWVIISVCGDVKKISRNYFNSSNIFGAIYFKDEATVQAAIEEIVNPFLAAHPDFVW